MEPIGPPHFRGGGNRGELIALTGRQKGLRRLLCTPLTFVGRAAVCDVRLNMPGIDPFHCLFVFVPTGLMIRDLNSSTGTFINSERISQVTVHDGDTLAVGPFQFLIRLQPEESDPQPPLANRLDGVAAPANAPSPLGTPGGEGWGEGGMTSHPEPPHPNPLPLSTGGEGTFRNALRIQAAAVAAQHAAVTEEEIRLLQRQGALHEQELQISARFERERLQLEALHTQTQTERDALHKERAEYEDFVALVATCLDDAQNQLVQAYQQIQTERRRLAQTDRRIKKHNQALLAAKQEELNWREEQLANDTCNLQVDAENLAKQARALDQERLHLVTEYEIGRRRLTEAWQRLRCDTAKWTKRRRLERTALNVRARDLAISLTHLVAEARDLHLEKKAWRHDKHVLEIELAALDNRICVQRMNLVYPGKTATDETRIEHGQDKTLTVFESCSIRGLMGFLADQRTELVEHWNVLAVTESAWQSERRRVIAMLESLATQLREQENNLAERTRLQETESASFARRRDELIRVEEQTVVWRSRLRVQELTSEAKRDGKRIDPPTESLDAYDLRTQEELAKLRDELENVAHALLARPTPSDRAA